jgi:hypothetical protein
VAQGESILSRLLGTLRDTFRISRATLSAGGLTAARTFALPDRAGTLALVLPGPALVLTDAATVALDASLGNRFTVTLGGNRTLSFSNVADGQIVEVEVYQDGTGGRTLSYSGITIRWQGGTAPTLTSGANKLDVIAVRRSGANYIGYFANNF